MTLEGEIHALWASDSPLAALLPVGRLFTGEARGNPALPYAVLQRGPAKIVSRTNAGSRIEEVNIQFHVWSARLEQAKQIVQELVRVFDQATFSFDGSTVLDFRRTKSSEQSFPDGVWEFACEYSALVRVG